MWATRKNWQRTLLSAALSLIATASAYSQGRPTNGNPLSGDDRISAGPVLPNCAVPSLRTAALRRFERFEAGATVADEWSDDWNTAKFSAGGCVAAQPDVPRASACQETTGTRTAWGAAPLCADRAPTESPSLSGLGKNGQKISAAREEVLRILNSPNTCSEWFQTKDPFPARTFQSLSFEVDRRGQTDVLESPLKDGTLVFRHPYVAWAVQDGGPFTTVTINANGAFYRTQGRVDRLDIDGGPIRLDGMRSLMVGSYAGDTKEAQIVTLLHELGHVISLLPQDGDDLDGSSMHNTDEVLRHCRPEVDVRAQEAKKGRHH